MSATVVGRGVSMVATVAFTALFSRHVGVEGFGQYAYALSLATLLGGLCGFGLDSWAIRELVRFPDAAARIIGRSLFLQLILSVVCLGGLAIYFGFVRHDPTLLAVSLIVGAYTFLDASGLLVISVFRAREVMQYEAAAVVIGNVSLIVLTALGVALHWGIAGTLALVGASFALKFAVIVWLAKERCGLGSLHSEFRPSLRPIQVGFPFFVTSLGNTIYSSYPRLLLAGFVLLPVVGVYAAAERVIALVLVLPGILDVVVYPIFARRVEASREAFARTYEELVDFTLVVGLLTGLGVACLFPEIVRILFGGSYRGAIPLGMLLVPSIVMSALGYVNARAMLVLHREKILSIAIAISAVGGIVAALVLVPLFGANGMAATVLASSVAGCLFYFFYLRVNLGLPWLTSRHVVFFGLFALSFVVAFHVQTAGLFERIAVDGVLALCLLPLFRIAGMLDWLRVFHLPADMQRASSAV